jgi:hypothetical protein
MFAVLWYMQRYLTAVDRAADVLSMFLSFHVSPVSCLLLLLLVVMLFGTYASSKGCVERPQLL